MSYKSQKGPYHWNHRQTILPVFVVVLFLSSEIVFALEYVPATKRIGVLSVMGDYARLTGLGMGAYDWRMGAKRDVLKRMNASNWQIDAYVHNEISAYLRANTPYEPSIATIEPKTLGNIFDWRGDLHPEGGGTLAKLVNNSDIKFLLLIAPTTYQNISFIHLGKYHVPIKGKKFYGYGSFYYKGGDMSVYVLAAAYLINISTGETKFRSYIGCQQRIKLGTRPLRDAEKKKIFKYVTEGINDQDVITFFRERIFAPTISEKTKKEIIEKYEEWNTDENSDDYAAELETMLNPVHHTIHTFNKISEMDRQKIGNKIKTCMNKPLKEAVLNLITRIK